MTENEVRRILEPWLTNPRTGLGNPLCVDSLGASKNYGGEMIRLTWNIDMLRTRPKHSVFLSGRTQPELLEALAWYINFKRGPGGME